MKKWIVLLTLAASLLGITGCQRDTSSDSSVANGMEGSETSGSWQEEGIPVSVAESGGDEDCDCLDGNEVVIKLRIVDGAETGNLTLAGEYEVYTLSLRNYTWLPEHASMPEDVYKSMREVPVYLDGELADSSVLEDGMMIEIAFNGMIEETFPCQFGEIFSISAYSRGTEQNPRGSYYDLCGLYLQVLNDLWEKDSGLNGGVKRISVDLSQAPGGLTAGEKQAIAWIFAGQHNAESLALSYEELVEAGYLTETGPAQESKYKLYQWEDGILFSITPAGQEEDEISYSLPVLTFNAQKWRSPLGAYYFSDCMAVWPEMGVWESYNIGSELIS